MKFSHSLHFNSVPEWRDGYLDYDHLKKTIYTLEKGLYDGHPVPYRDNPPPAPGADIENESAALLDAASGGASDPLAARTDGVFVPLLDAELGKIVRFYASQERRLFADVDHVGDDVSLAEQEELALDSDDDDDSDEDDAEAEGEAQAAAHESGLSTRPLPAYASRRRRRRSSESSAHADHVRALAYDHAPGAHSAHPPASRSAGPGHTRTQSQRKRTTSAGSWNPLRRVRSPSAARTDVSAASSARRAVSIWESEDDYAIDVRITFKRRLTDLFVSLSELQQYVHLNRVGMKKILKKYDKIVSRDLKERYLAVVDKQYPFTDAAKDRLLARTSSVVALFARVNTHDNTDLALNQLKTHLREEVVWQRNTVWREMIGIERKAQGATLGRDVMGSTQEEARATPWSVRIPRVGRVTLPSWFGLGTVQLLIALGVFVAILKMPSLRVFDRVEEQNCLAILALCTLLWATEVIPLFVTAFLVPFFVVVLRVARSDDGKDRRLSAHETAQWIFLQMFAPNMCLLLGGFTLAAALSKYGIDKVIAVKVLRLAGTRPSTVLLAHMAVAAFASMWVSNVAAPVLMFSLVQPILRTLPVGSPYARALIMGIALASNIGGQTSPIASPQNLIALQYMKDPVGWLQWFAIAIPVSATSVLAVWLLLLRIYGSGKGVVIRKVNPPSESFTKLQWFIVAVCIGTILLWCVERNLEYVLGDMGVVALIPLVVFFGTGILSKEDFNNFLWTVLFLAMGGIALGKAVTASGLLESLDDLIQGVVAHMSLAQVMLSLLSISLVVATFISHTIAAVLLVPIAAQVGESLDTPHPRLLIMAATLAASAAMGLPVSGFPNMTAASLEDSMGERYLAVKDFLKAGGVATVICGIIIASLGALIMLGIGL